MKYRVRIDASFDTELDARKIFTPAKNLKAKAKAMPNEDAFIHLERCRHDETPPRPCENVEKIAITKV